jgi:hypothetical protein
MAKQKQFIFNDPETFFKKRKEWSESNMPTLTDGEREVLDLLKSAYEKFIELPIQHPMHQMEFTLAIHSAQRLIMSRPTARYDGWVIEVGK